MPVDTISPARQPASRGRLMIGEPQQDIEGIAERAAAGPFSALRTVDGHRHAVGAEIA